MSATLQQVQVAWNDPDMEVCEHTAAEVRILLMFCERSTAGGRRWACHRDEHVWLGFTREDALQQALDAAPRKP